MTGDLGGRSDWQALVWALWSLGKSPRGRVMVSVTRTCLCPSDTFLTYLGLKSYLETSLSIFDGAGDNTGVGDIDMNINWNNPNFKPKSGFSSRDWILLSSRNLQTDWKLWHNLPALCLLHSLHTHGQYQSKMCGEHADVLGCHCDRRHSQRFNLCV